MQTDTGASQSTKAIRTFKGMQGCNAGVLRFWYSSRYALHKSCMHCIVPQKVMSCKPWEHLLSVEQDNAETIAGRRQTSAAASSRERLGVLTCLQQVQQAHSSTHIAMLYWKLVIAPLQSMQCGGNSSEAAATQQLHNWLALQLRNGTPSRKASDLSLWEAASVNHLHGTPSTRLPSKIKACFVFTHSLQQFDDALAGASGIVVVASSEGSIVNLIDNWLSKQVTPLPVLVLTVSTDAANSVRQQVNDMGIKAQQPIQVVHACSAPAGLCASTVQPPEFSPNSLSHGLRWLASQAPQQPSLQASRIVG